MPRGNLIVFEGIDNSGKTTQSKLLNYALSNSHLQVFPSKDTVLGKYIRDIITQKIPPIAHPAFALANSADRHERAPEIIERLKSGQTVILDRYIYSGLVYNHEQYNTIKNAEIGLPKPDIIFYIDTPPDITTKRADFGNDINDTHVRQNIIYNKYKSLCNVPKWKIIDGTRSIEEIHKNIIDVINNFSPRSSKVHLTTFEDFPNLI